MTDAEGDDLPEEDLAQIGSVNASGGLQSGISKKDFAPWHHPVKQVVREQQWADLTRKLIASRTFVGGVVNYFTLPGPDLFDVEMLANVCTPSELQIEYLGFLAGGTSGLDLDNESVRAPWARAEAALRQSGKITAQSEIINDRLEDIAVQQSNARKSLNKRRTFDVINIDGCGYLTHKPKNRDVCVFDALNVLLAHQSRAQSPWLLFLTTRAEAGELGDPGIHFQEAILKNLREWPVEFGDLLAEKMSWTRETVLSHVTAAWSGKGLPFMQIFTLGISKFLLQFFHRDSVLRSDVKLKSSYVYRVAGSELDMASLAFLITPDPAQAVARVDQPVDAPSLEPRRAGEIVKRIPKVWDIDTAIRTDPALQEKAVAGMELLLRGGNYDVSLWRSWLAGLNVRSLKIGEINSAARLIEPTG